MLSFFNHQNSNYSMSLYSKRMKYDDAAYMCFITHVKSQKPSLVVSKDGKSLVPLKEVKDTKKKK